MRVIIPTGRERSGHPVDLDSPTLPSPVAPTFITFDGCNKDKREPATLWCDDIFKILHPEDVNCSHALWFPIDRIACTGRRTRMEWRSTNLSSSTTWTDRFGTKWSKCHCPSKSITAPIFVSSIDTAAVSYCLHKETTCLFPNYSWFFFLLQ